MLKDIAADRDLADLSLYAAKMAEQVRKLSEEREIMLWAAVKAVGGRIVIPAESLDSLPEVTKTEYDAFANTVTLIVES